MRKWKIIVIVSLLVMGIPIAVSAITTNPYNGNYRLSTNTFDTSLYGTPLDTDPVTCDVTTEDLLNDGFEFISSSTSLELYVNKTILNIAIYDKRNQYIWFGYYENYDTKGYTDSVNYMIESGITVSYFDALTLNEARASISDPDVGTDITYQHTNQGFIAMIDMVKLGISFELSVSLKNDEITVVVPDESIVEVPYKTIAMKYAKEYKVQSIAVFPYLGSENYEINGYAMIPDGSGALMRYTDIPNDSAYIKRVYGRDLGIQSNVTSSDHLKRDLPVTLPVYGINHGYQQAAFIAELNSGFGAAEIHSYPYMYNNIDLNTTFFTYRTRDRVLIKLSGGDTSSIPIINENPYPFDLSITYSFLANEQANYAGMASRYRDHLNLDKQADQTMDLHLELIGIDSKPSLFGEQKVTLTTYDDVSTIIEDLSVSVDHMTTTLRSWNVGGIYGKYPNSFRLSARLGGKSSFKHMMETATSNQVEISLYSTPLVVANPKVFDQTLQRTTLDQFVASMEGSRAIEPEMLTIDHLGDRILQNEKRYTAYDIRSLSLGYVGNFQFSYHHNNQTVYREEMIHQLMNEVASLSNYEIGLYEPSAYMFPYIARYYQAPYQSNLYAYITDSIPFISLVLSGSIQLYSPLLNYESDLSSMVLKMIEYNLRPSFVVTSKPGYYLRYTNFEYLYTTEYDLWKQTIKDVYSDVSEVLSVVSGEYMISHEVIAEGVIHIGYEQYDVYVNYTEDVYTNGSWTVDPHDAIVLEVM